MDVIINDKRKIIVQGNVFWIRVKELDAWVPDFEDDNNDDLSSDEEEPKANNIDETSDVDRVSESSFMQEMDHVIDSVRVDSTRSKTREDKSGENEPHSEDPFKMFVKDHVWLFRRMFNTNVLLCPKDISLNIKLALDSCALLVSKDWSRMSFIQYQHSRNEKSIDYAFNLRENETNTF
ncbi:hypothetical protein Tco_0911330 [Tanacetum coccineum]|uniref:RNA-directed DNA polymerase, eukaryota n=1 Tax=Tanacetum coccineum TaxID=301880 RepID=A0ABQ5CVH1_9ASTR